MDYLSGRVARFMVPRYVEIVDELPKTPTQKIRKVELRAAGVGPRPGTATSAGPGRDGDVGREGHDMRVVLTLGGDQRATAAEAQTAEAHGFDGIATGEHLVFHGPVTNAFVSLAAAAGCTSRIRLLSSLTLLPLYAATLAAKLASTLDQVSGGRLNMGVGAGGEFPPEFVAAGVDVTSRGARTDEALELMKALWSG